MSGDHKIRLDHVGFAGATLEAMRREWQSLGFAPTEPQPLRSVDRQGRSDALGQHSCHVVLACGYIELTEVAEVRGHHLEPWLARGPGLHILAFGTTAIDAWRARQVGDEYSPVMTAARSIDYGSRHGEARFRWCMRDATRTPWALECLVEHLTPELVHQDEVEQHRNGARVLRAITLESPEPAALQAEFARLYGVGSDVLECVRGVEPRCIGIEIAVADLSAWLATRDAESCVSSGAGRLTASGAFEIELETAPGSRVRLTQA
jgi:hypothetical protein